MGLFKEFIANPNYGGIGEEQKDVLRTLSKIPPTHAALVKGYKWKFMGGNTLDGDDQHVGYMDDHEKEIAVAAPWNYGREFTVLHEIAHRVWDNLLKPEQKQQWTTIVQGTKNKQKQSPEELFCMAYANHFVKNKVVVHDHPTWHQFIQSICQTGLGEGMNEARYKGFERQFQHSYPTMPKYVAKQIYTNRIGSELKRQLRTHHDYMPDGEAVPDRRRNNYLAPTIDYPESPRDKLSSGDYTVASSPGQSPSFSLRPSPTNIIDSKADYLQDVKWLPKPVVVEVSPLDFDRETIQLFALWRFGFSPKDHAVRNDTQRFGVQRDILKNKQTAGENEPTVMIKMGNKYKLVEGFHRTMLMLLSPYNNQEGAPPEQIAALEKGDVTKIDLSKWGKVRIKAYLGIKNELSQ